MYQRLDGLGITFASLMNKSAQQQVAKSQLVSNKLDAMTAATNLQAAQVAAKTAADNAAAQAAATQAAQTAATQAAQTAAYVPPAATSYSSPAYSSTAPQMVSAPAPAAQTPVDTTTPAARPAGGNNTMILIGLAALAALFLFKKH